MRISHRVIGSLLVLCVALAVASTSFGLSIVAMTTIVSDVVRTIAGDGAELVTLLSLDVDPHAFQATPRDAVALSNADVVFLSGRTSRLSSATFSPTPTDGSSTCLCDSRCARAPVAKPTTESSIHTCGSTRPT